LEMSSSQNQGNTLVCFDTGCIFVQGFTNITIGLFTIGLGLYMKFK